MDTTDDQTSLAFARSPKSKEDSLAQQKTGERTKSQYMEPPHGEVLKPSSSTMERIRMGEDNSYHLHKEDGTAVEKGTVGASTDAKADNVATTTARSRSLSHQRPSQHHVQSLHQFQLTLHLPRARKLLLRSAPHWVAQCKGYTSDVTPCP